MWYIWFGNFLLLLKTCYIYYCVFINIFIVINSYMEFYCINEHTMSNQFTFIRNLSSLDFYYYM